jgi:hypothetical protein
MPVYAWSTTAVNNATADNTINWAEGMAPSAVNDSARAQMAAEKKFFNDAVTIAHTTGGTSAAYTLTTDSGYDTLAHLDKQQLTFVPHATSGAAPTLAVDGLAAKPINGPASGTAIPTGALVQGVPYAVLYDNANNQFILLGYRDTLLNATITGTLGVTGAATLSSTLGVTGASTFTGATTHSGGLTSTTGAFSGAITQMSGANSYEALATGTTAQRPGSPAANYFRYNSTLGCPEFFDGTTWWPLTGGPVPAGLKNLLVVNDSGSPNTKMDVTADYVCVQTTSNVAYGLNSVSLVIDCGTNGANGLDTGGLAASTWYSIWVIYNPATGAVAGLMSTSATAPIMPSGYTARARLGWVFTDGTAHFYRIRQQGRRAQYVVGTNPASTRIIASGSAGTFSTTNPVYASASIANFVPSTASCIYLAITSNYQGGGTTNVSVAPNTSYGGSGNGLAGSAGMIAPWAMQFTTAGGSNVSTWMELENATTIAWNSSGSGGALGCLGWEDNI